MEKKNFASSFISWLYGGQDRQFFADHMDQIRARNAGLAELMSEIMTVVALLYYIFDLNSGGTKQMRLSYLVFFTIFLVIAIVSHISGHRLFRSHLCIILLFEVIFLFVLFVGPVFDSDNLACYVPVYLIVCQLLMISPITVSGPFVIVNMIIFFFVDFRFKSFTLAMYDLVDSVTCSMIGFAVGFSVLRSRLNEIAAYSELKEQSESELKKALDLANKDPLTGIRSRAAYENMAQAADSYIAQGTSEPFAIIVCDVNNLKKTNDSLGHGVGDRLIIECCRSIQSVFTHSSMYRIGGDELVVLVKGTDYPDRKELFNTLCKAALSPSGIMMFACGMADYDRRTDHTLADVFIRADNAMYENKEENRK